MPGFGDVAAARRRRDPPTLAAAIARAPRRRSGVERPHVAGNSLGGWVALELALAGHARSVTAIAPAGLWAQPLRAAALAARARSPARCGRCCRSLLRSERGRRAALGGDDRAPGAGAATRRRSQLVRAYANAPGFDAANAGMRAGRFTGLAEIDVPLTLAWPEHDRLVAPPARRARRARASSSCAAAATCPPGTTPSRSRASCSRAARLRHATLTSPPSRIAMLAR